MAIYLNLVDVMDEFVYSAFDTYFKTLEKLGYMSQRNVNSLLVLNFFYELIYQDYRGYVKQEDYHAIDEALNCLYGTTCLIPYPDYLKMGKLKLGEMTEVLSRVKTAEEELRVHDLRIKDNDALIEDNIRRIDEHGTRLDSHDEHLSDHDTHLTAIDNELYYEDGGETKSRLSRLENTNVVKGKNHIQDIPDIVFPE